jgi:hypothetical protein
MYKATRNETREPHATCSAALLIRVRNDFAIYRTKYLLSLLIIDYVYV